MPLKLPLQIPVQPTITNPIQMPIDQIKFNDVPLDSHVQSIWPADFDKRRVDFTVHNDSNGVAIPYGVVTGDIFDGDAKIMTSGYEKRDFFSVSSAIGPLGVGEKATGFLLMKWDDNWISKQHGVGSCQLQLQFWGQQNEYHPDKGDRLFTIEIPDPHPNEPDRPPPDPNAPFVPQPVVHKTSNTVIFVSLSYAGGSIDIYPGCGPRGDFLHWPELSAQIFVNAHDTDLLPTSNEVRIVQRRAPTLPDP